MKYFFRGLQSVIKICNDFTEVLLVSDKVEPKNGKEFVLWSKYFIIRKLIK